jgi:hypothetical protein
LVLILVAGIFFLQRDYSGRSSALFPDVVLLAVVALSLAIIVQGVRRGSRERQAREVDLRKLAAAGVLVLVWGTLTGLIGFTISGVIAFVIASLMVRHSRPTARTLAIDTSVGLVLVVGAFFIFTRLLLVPLPVSSLIGM